MKKREYIFDFETFGENFYKKHGYTKIYLWDACDMETMKHTHGDTIDSFLDFALREGVSGYFHNLAFDIEFILYGLDSKGYKSVSKEEELKPHTYYILKQGMTIYKLCICENIKTVGKQKRTKKSIITIKDSLKILNFKVSELQEAFNLDIGKEFDNTYYDKERDINYQISEEDIRGCEHDTEVVAKALIIMRQHGMDKLTLSSSAFANWKKFLGEDNKFRYKFPKLDYLSDSYLRRGYFGGYCYCNPRHINEVFDNVYCYDVNSEYPYIYSTRPLPYGQPMFFKGKYEYDEHYPLYIQRIEVCCDVKEGYVPTIQLKKAGLYSGVAEYMTTTDDLIIELTLTSPDLELLKEHYHIHYISYIDGYKFKSDSTMFTDFTNYYMALKMQATQEKNAVLRQIAKLNLNSLYGKFAMGMISELYRVEKDDEGILHIAKVGEQLADGVYLPLAMFVTAYARQYLINSIQSNYDNFLYCDTDSMYLTSCAKNIIIDIDNRGTLGEWKLEHIVDNFKMLQPKRYTYRLRDKETGKVKCAGMSKELQKKMSETYRDEELIMAFNIGYSDIQLKKRKVKGGCVLYKTDFILKER
jgi:hypothetical protein